MSTRAIPCLIAVIALLGTFGCSDDETLIAGTPAPAATDIAASATPSAVVSESPVTTATAEPTPQFIPGELHVTGRVHVTKRSRSAAAGLTQIASTSTGCSRSKDLV